MNDYCNNPELHIALVWTSGTMMYGVIGCKQVSEEPPVDPTSNGKSTPRQLVGGQSTRARGEAPPVGLPTH